MGGKLKPARSGKPKLCIDCNLQAKKPGHAKWCPECWLRRQPASVQTAEGRRRLARVPIEQHRTRAQAQPDAPDGKAWCAGCQSYRLHLDFSDTATQCRVCLSDKAHRAMVVRTYQLQDGDYDALFELQDGRCAICGNQQKIRRLAVDHDHEDEHVRGLLCLTCNEKLLGEGARGSLRILQSAVYYLMNNPTGGKWDPRVRDSQDLPPY